MKYVSGYVYVITEEPPGNYYIIATTQPIEKVICSLQPGNPRTLQYMHTIKNPEYKAIANMLHHIFAKNHKGGKWYELSGEEYMVLVSLLYDYDKLLDVANSL